MDPYFIPKRLLSIQEPSLRLVNENECQEPSLDTEPLVIAGVGLKMLVYRSKLRQIHSQKDNQLSILTA